MIALTRLSYVGLFFIFILEVITRLCLTEDLDWAVHWRFGEFLLICSLTLIVAKSFDHLSFSVTLVITYIVSLVLNNLNNILNLAFSLNQKGLNLLNSALPSYIIKNYYIILMDIHLLLLYLFKLLILPLYVYALKTVMSCKVRLERFGLATAPFLYFSQLD